MSDVVVKYHAPDGVTGVGPQNQCPGYKVVYQEVYKNFKAETIYIPNMNTVLL